jgi:ABC-type Fe3+ transport system, permease component
LGVLGFSFFQAFLSAFLSVLLGFGVAWIQVHYHFPGKRWFRLLTFLPFVLPSIVVVLAMILFFGNNGWINRGLMMFLGEKEPPLQFLYSLNGILIAHVYYNFPIAAKLIGDQWSRLSEDFERAARSLGAGGLNRFFGLTLPMLRPSLVSAFILIFLLCLNSFPIILVLGGGIHHTTIEVQIYQLKRIELDLEGAAVLALRQA